MGSEYFYSILTAVDQEAVAKWFVYINIAHSLFINAGPKLALETYKFPTENIDSVAILGFERLGGLTLANAVSAYCLLLEKTSLETAAKANSIVWGYTCLRNWLNGDAKKHGFGGANQVGVALLAIQFYTMTQEDYSTGALKFFSIFWAVAGALNIWNPEMSIKAWGGDTKISEAVPLIMSLNGYGNLAMSATFLSMLYLDATATQGVGAMAGILGLSQLENIISGNFKKAGVDVKQAAVGAVVMGILSSCLLLAEN